MTRESRCKECQGCESFETQGTCEIEEKDKAVDRIAQMEAELSLLRDQCEYMREQLTRSEGLLAKIKSMLSGSV